MIVRFDILIYISKFSSCWESRFKGTKSIFYVTIIGTSKRDIQELKFVNYLLFCWYVMEL